MKLPGEQRLFAEKWIAYGSCGYQVNYREETREKELKEEVYTAEKGEVYTAARKTICTVQKFNAETVIQRSESIFDWIIKFFLRLQQLFLLGPSTFFIDTDQYKNFKPYF